MANLIEIVINARDNASGVLKGLNTSLDTVGGQLTKLGSSLSLVTAPLVAGFGLAAKSAMDFQESMTNAGSVLGKTADQMKGLNAEILKIGGASRAGPQAVADSFYDIVSGVADASTHMAILNAAIATSEAGAADLGETTQALISVMNSYSFAADKASFVSDVLSRTVAMGVGSMGDFAAALPAITGLASQSGIALDDLGAQVAYLTTKGFSASEAVTDLRSALVAIISPNQNMIDLMAKAGITSGETALKTMGLNGVLDALSKAAGGSQQALSDAFGRVEALQAGLAIATPQFKGFFDTFKSGVEGATEAARKIQEQSAAFQFDKLKSALSELAITIGQLILPALNKIVGAVNPIIHSITDWAGKNPRLVTTIMAILTALIAAGPILIGVGTAIKQVTDTTSTLNTVLSLATGPIGIVVAALGALYIAYTNNFLGIKDALAPLVEQLNAGFAKMGEQVNVFVARFKEGGLTEAVHGFFAVFEDGSSTISTILQGFGMNQTTADSIAKWFSDAFDKVKPIFDSVVKGIEDFARGFSTNIALVPFYAEYYFGKARDFIGTAFANIWNVIGPTVQPIITWLTGTGPNTLSGAVSSVGTFVQTQIIEPFKGIWVAIQPALNDIKTWFEETGWPAIETAIGKVQTAWSDLTTSLKGFWADIQPALSPVVDGLTKIFQPVVDLINKALDSWEILRRLGNGTPLRALPGESSPGVTAPATTTAAAGPDWSLTPGEQSQVEDFYKQAVIDSLKGTAAGAALSIGSGVSEAISNFITDVRMTAARQRGQAIRVGEDMAHDVVNSITELGQNFPSGIQSIGDLAFTAGSLIGKALAIAATALGSNLTSGVTSMQQAAYNAGAAVGNLINNVIGVIGSAAQGTTDLGTGTPFTNAGTAYSGGGGGSPYLHDFEGGYSGNTPMMIGTGAQPELFIPNSSGYAIPNADKLGGGPTSVTANFPNVTDRSKAEEIFAIIDDYMRELSG